jgi:hypothetical protein
MRIIETRVYTITEHPAPEKCFEWIRNNWHDLNAHTLNDVVDSLKALQERIGGELDYSISQWPDRGEFIRLTDYDQEALDALDAEACPLTGIAFDFNIITGLRNGDIEKVLKAVHADTEWVYSNEGLRDLCESNEYEFDESGQCV